jgi:hypothetical protein
MGRLDQAVGKRRFAMINMSYNAKISYIFHFSCYRIFLHHPGLKAC